MLTKLGKTLINVAFSIGNSGIVPNYTYSSASPPISPRTFVPAVNLRQNTFPTVYIDPFCCVNSFTTTSSSTGSIYIPCYDSNTSQLYKYTPTGGNFIIGTGTTPPTEDDINLENPIILPSSTGSKTISCTGTNFIDDTTNHILKRKDLYAIPNYFSEDITITEYGVISSFYKFSTTKGGSFGTASAIALIARGLFENPITIPAGESGAIDFITEFDYSSWLEDESQS